MVLTYVIFDCNDSYYINSCMFAFKELKCINCGSNPKGPILALKEGNVIEGTCLQDVEKLLKDPSVDEAMKEFYAYIINMVLKCLHCGSNIDANCKNSMINDKQPTCEKCFLLGRKNIFVPLKKKQAAQCFQCEKILQGIHLIRATEIDGLHICIFCMEGQPPKNHELKQSIRPEHHFMAQKGPNKLSHKASMPNFSAREFYKPFKNEVKIETISCQKCRKTLKANNFSGISGNHFICNDCKFKQSLVKKPRKPIQGGFGLADLFYNSDEEDYQFEMMPFEQKQEKKEEKKFLIFQMKEEKVMEEAKEEKIENLNIPEELNTRKSLVYQLKECKLCFNAQSAMINVKCRHIMMCELCLNLMKAKHGKKEEVPCPVCATVGKYQLYIEPIYI